MGQDPEELRREIEQTRAELTTDVDALTEKVTPSRVVERRVEKTKAGVIGLKEKVMGTTHEKASSVGDGLAAARNTVADRSPGGSDSASGGGVSDKLHAATGKLHSAKDGTSGAAATLREKSEGNPLAAGIVAFGIGWLISSLLPASEKETQAAGKLVETAKEHAGEVKEQLTDAAKSLVDELQPAAEEAVASVKATATDAASQVKETATSGSR